MVAITELAIPRNDDAERAVVGVCIQSADSLREVAAYLNVSDFFLPAVALIYDAALSQLNEGEPIEPVAIMERMRQQGTLQRAGGAPYLHTLVAVPVAGTNVGYYARIVLDLGRVRRAREVIIRMAQVVQEVPDHDELMMHLATSALQLELLVDERAHDAPVEGLSTWNAFLAQPDDPLDWIIPDCIERQDVMLFLASEGGGKSYLVRQILLAISAGVNPFRPAMFVPPKRTLLVDLENAESMLRREGRVMREKTWAMGTRDPGESYVWSKPDGLNLRKTKDAKLLERVISDTEPAVVGLGSLYKAFQRAGDDWDTAAAETREVLDGLRRRYRCAFILEHHMPKGSGDGTDRPASPYGSSEWMRWASVGRIVNRVGDNMFELAQFRGDRGPRDLPVGLTRSSTELPWSSVWDHDEVVFGMWPALRHKRKLD